MTLLSTVAGIILGLGLTLIVFDYCRIPTLGSSKALKSLSKRQKRHIGSLDILLQDFAVWFTKFIRINEYKRIQLVSDLQTAGMNISPELHIANSFVKALLVAVFAIPAFFVFPLIAPVILAFAVGIYFGEMGSVKKRIGDKREKIEYELPRFVFTIEKTLKYNRDVLGILENYKDSAGSESQEFKQELEITIADMRSSNYESALTRLESRVGSSMLSDVVRGLIGVIRGDETELYWSALSIKFADIGRQALKRKAQKVPAKVKRLSMTLLFCFLFSYLVILFMEIITSLGAVFAR